jgi:hypothetical protein
MVVDDLKFIYFILFESKASVYIVCIVCKQSDLYSRTMRMWANVGYKYNMACELIGKWPLRRNEIWCEMFITRQSVKAGFALRPLSY